MTMKNGAEVSHWSKDYESPLVAIQERVPINLAAHFFSEYSMVMAQVQLLPLPVVFERIVR